MGHFKAPHIKMFNDVTVQWYELVPMTGHAIQKQRKKMQLYTTSALSTRHCGWSNLVVTIY